MTALAWDQVGERRYETGVDRGVLYLPNNYAVAWNGLTQVSESREREVKPYYLDGVKYLDHYTPGEFSGKLSAFTYPDELAFFVGDATFLQGVILHDQPAKTFHLSYRTKVGNDVDGIDHGYKIHLLYNLLAVPSSPSMATLGESIAPAMFEWSLTGIPVAQEGYRPTNHVSLDSRGIDPAALAEIELGLYGSEALAPELPSLSELLSRIQAAVDANSGGFPPFNPGGGVQTG